MILLSNAEAPCFCSAAGGPLLSGAAGSKAASTSTVLKARCNGSESLDEVWLGASRH